MQTRWARRAVFLGALGGVTVPPAGAGKDEPEAVLDVTGARKVGPVTLTRANWTAKLDGGVAIPVRREGTLRAVAWIGQGAIEASFPRRGDAIAFANRQVLWAGRPREAMAPVARGEAPLRGNVSHGVVVGIPEWADLLLAGEAAVAPADLSTVRDRLDTLGLHGVEEKRNRADFLTDVSFGYVRAQGGPSPEDRWLGMEEYRYAGGPAQELNSVGRDAEGTVQQGTVALDTWRDPMGELRSIKDGVVPVSLDLVVTVSAPRGKDELGVDVDTTWRFRADEELSRLVVDIPRDPDLKEGWAVTSALVDGQAATFVPSPIGGRVEITLPAPIAKGKEATLQLLHTTRWSLLNPGSGFAGRSTGMQFPVPVFGPGAWPFRARIGIPEGSGLAVAATGTTSGDSVEAGVRWVETATDTRPSPVVVGIGEWVTHTEAAVEGLPQLRVHLFRDEARTLPSIPPFARTIVSYYERLLPQFPVRELEVFQASDATGGYVWTATQGLVTLQQMRVGASDSVVRGMLAPHLEEGTLAHEIAHQYWGSLVDTERTEDAWMVETLAEVYSCMLVGAVFGAADCDARKKEYRAVWEEDLDSRTSASLQGAQGSDQWRNIAYSYGPYLMLEMLRPRIGDNAFLGALDGYARSRGDVPASADSLRYAFEKTSGRDLGAFFDYWVIGGIVPTLTLSWDAGGATVRSNVPFGTIDVPVRIWPAGGRPVDLWVDVVDGVGEVTFPEAPARVALDPDGRVLAHGRKVSRR